MISKAEIIIGLVLVALIGLLIFVSVEEQKEWDAFAKQNNCKVIGKTKGTTDVGTGVTSGGGVGMVTVSTSGTTSYLCDDGVTYTR